MLSLVKRLLVEEEGQGMAEYGLILALIAVVVIGVLATMGDKLQEVFNQVNEKLPATSESGSGS
ncbi:MAG TPA: Flp family type IVb pilin [Syntrophothermus lipocalidus]|nr:Flp family type IVb pilin [Syntrophothermus lipocalidus]